MVMKAMQVVPVALVVVLKPVIFDPCRVPAVGPVHVVVFLVDHNGLVLMHLVGVHVMVVAVMVVVHVIDMPLGSMPAVYPMHVLVFMDVGRNGNSASR
jgi:hypothetical protein